MEITGQFSVPAVKMLIADTLRMFVGGYGKRFTWPELAEATWDRDGDLKTWERRLRSYVEDGGSLMPVDVMMRVFSVLPPQAFQRIATRMGFSVAPMEVEEAASVRRAGAAAARIAAKVADANEDGQFTHSEMIEIVETITEEMPSIHSVVGAGTAPR